MGISNWCWAPGASRWPGLGYEREAYAKLSSQLEGPVRNDWHWNKGLQGKGCKGQIGKDRETGGHQIAGKPSLSLTLHRVSCPAQNVQKWSCLEHGPGERGWCVSLGFLPSCLYFTF